MLHFKKNYKNVIRKKLILYFVVSSVIVNLVGFYTYYNTRILTYKLNTIFTNDVNLTNLCDTIDSVEASLKAYLTTSHSTDLQDYLVSSNNLRQIVTNLKTTLSNNESDLLYVDIKNMMFTYLQHTDFAVQEKRGRNIDGYTDEFNEATQVYNYINEYIDKLKVVEFRENNANYLRLSNELQRLQFFNMIILIVGLCVNFVLVLLFAYRITEPIIRLSKAASEIAKGNYNIPKIAVKTNDEIKTLAVSFNRMAESIKKQLIEIRKKAEIENRLKQQEMQNIKMKSMLDEAELRSLQAQIDPHFMFNTLNAAMQLAMFEDAERTQLFLENFSNLLRYNLGTISIPSTILDEISNIESYIYLLKERYGRKFEFNEYIEDGIPNLQIPRMTLQPIVENSFIHGINEMESGGVISVSVKRCGDYVHVVISDNGRGMSKETIDKILSDNHSSLTKVDSTGHKSQSIGLRNVISRLMLFYHIEKESDVIEIESISGTKTTLKLPIKREET